MKKLRKLEKNLLTSIVTCIVSLLGFAASSFLLLGEYRDIPLGFLFGGLVIGGLYLLTFFLSKKDEENVSSNRTVIVIFLRLLLIIALMIVVAFMNYRWNAKYFNLFVFIGIYTVGVLTYILSNLFLKED